MAVLTRTRQRESPVAGRAASATIGALGIATISSIAIAATPLPAYSQAQPTPYSIVATYKEPDHPATELGTCQVLIIKIPKGSFVPILQKPDIILNIGFVAALEDSAGYQEYNFRAIYMACQQSINMTSPFISTVAAIKTTFSTEEGRTEILTELNRGSTDYARLSGIQIKLDKIAMLAISTGSILQLQGVNALYEKLDRSAKEAGIDLEKSIAQAAVYNFFDWNNKMLDVRVLLHTT